MAQLVARLVWDQEARGSSPRSPTNAVFRDISELELVMPADIDAAKYVSFTSYKKDGTPISLPVWVVPFDGGYAFTTDTHSFKVKRIRNDARASLTVCNIKGSIATGATVYEGAAVVLNATDTARVAELVKAKYKIGWAMLGIMSTFKKIIGKGATATAECAIKVTLHS